VAVRPAANAGMPATVALSAVGLGALLGYGAVGLAARKRQATLAIEAEDMWWGDKEYPPSKVLGIGRNVGSKFYGITSGLALGIGIYCIAVQPPQHPQRVHRERLVRGGGPPGAVLLGPPRGLVDPEAERQIGAAWQVALGAAMGERLRQG